jgi:hypothetical protein
MERLMRGELEPYWVLDLELMAQNCRFGKAERRLVVFVRNQQKQQQGSAQGSKKDSSLLFSPHFELYHPAAHGMIGFTI